MSGQKKKNQSAAFLHPISCTEQYDWEKKDFPTTESDRFQIFKMLQSKMKCPLKKEIYIYDSMFNKLPTITKKKKKIELLSFL